MFEVILYIAKKVWYACMHVLYVLLALCRAYRLLKMQMSPNGIHSKGHILSETI